MPTPSFANAGIAGFEIGDLVTEGELFNSAIPHPATEDFPVGENTTLEAFAVVGLSSGNLVMAKTSSTAVVPIGVMTAKVVTGAGQTDRIAIFRQGNFNRDALVWHADYDTNAKKEAAFRGSPSPTNIIIRGRL